MSARFAANNQVINGLSTMSATMSSSDIHIFNQIGFSAQIRFSSSAATGSFKVQTSDISGSWSDVADSTTTISGVSTYTWNVRDVFSRDARIVGTISPTFTGSVNAWVTKKA